VNRPARAKTIGIDARKVRDLGVGSYIRNLTEALARSQAARDYRFVLFVRRSDATLFESLPETFRLVVDDAPDYSAAELTRFAWKLFRARLDLFHATHYVLPPAAFTPAVVTIHDIIHLLYPQFLPHRAAWLYARAMIRRALRRSRRVITVSFHSKQDLVDYFGVSPERISVIYNGVSSRFRSDIPASDTARVCERYGIRAPYLLFVGGQKPHKNLPGLLRAYANARRRAGFPHTLAIVGPKPRNPWPIDAAISSLGIESSVRRTGLVPDEDLPALYAGATLFLYPTLYEGFGLPVVEAMACGTPVLTSSTSALREIAGGAADLVDPLDQTAIADRIARLLADESERRRLARVGLERARDFSWDTAAEKTAAIYREALER
jgi:glycosyltransferase involved in cell wall biosynthesis